MSFWDNVKKIAQPYADEDYDDDYDDDVEDFEEPQEQPRENPIRARRSAPESDFGFGSAPASAPSSASTPSGSFTGSVVGGGSGSKQEVVLFRPTSFSESSKAADFLRAKKAVVINMENVDKALTRRVVDFMTGCAYSLDGKVKKVAQATYLFCPSHMEVTGDLENLQSEVESYM